MKIIKFIAASFIMLSMLVACDNGNKNIPFDTSKSAQKAADEVSKSFNAASVQKSKSAVKSKKLSAAAKKTVISDSGIVGLPKDMVEGANVVIEKTKDIVNKAVEKISDSEKSVDTSSAKGENDLQTATDSIPAQKAAEELSKAFEIAPTKESQIGSSNKKQTSPSKKPALADSGIVGLPKGVVEGAGTIIEKTKEVVTDAVANISEPAETSNKPVQNGDKGGVVE